jgi:hypothetical protein
MPKLKILVFVDSDPLVRHFLDAGAFSELAQLHDLRLVLPPDGYQRLRSAIPQDSWGLELHRVSISEEHRILWKRLFYIDQARFRPGRDWADIRRGWRAIVGWKAALQFGFYALPFIRQIVCAIMRSRLANRPASNLEALLDSQTPDILIHPSTFDGYFINDVIAAARDRKIPSVLLMNSWDNPTLKRAAVGQPDAVAVWGEQSRAHSVRFMRLPEDKVHILGAAQFDVYRDAPVETRESICYEHGIDPANRILMYAGSSKGNWESQHLHWLSDAIDRGELKATTILYRPHPYGLDVEDAREIINNTPQNVRIESSMVPLLNSLASGERGGFFITPYSRTHSLLCAVDALVSPLSTIILEAGVHEKPVMCFIPWEEDEDSIWKKLRDLIHFRDLLECPSVIVAHSHDEFLPSVTALMAKVNDPDYSRKVKDDIEFFVEFPQQRYGEKLVLLVDRLLGRDAAA